MLNKIKVCLQRFRLCLPKKNITKMFGQLKLKIIRKNGEVEDFGIVSRKKVTDVYVQFIVDKLVAAGNINTFVWHDSGTGTNAENKTDIGLQTPCGESRDEGSQLEGASANIYKTVATHTYAGTFEITEHCVFNADSNGIAMDRSVFTAKPVDSGDKIEYTYELTCQAED